MALSGDPSNELKPLEPPDNDVPGSGEGSEIRVSTPLCDACVSNNTAENYCNQCGEYLCANCTSYHKISRKTSAHVLVPVNTGSDICDVKTKCEKHPQNDIDSYCSECKTLACFDCARRDHVTTATTTHSIRQLTGSRQEVTELYLDKTKTFHSVYNAVKDKQNNIEKSEKDFVNNCDDVEKEIEERRINVMKIVNQIADGSLKEIRAARQLRGDEYQATSRDAHALMVECERVATPFVMGLEVNDIIKQLLLVEQRVAQANDVLVKISELENSGTFSICGTKESINVVSDVIETYLHLDHVKSKTSSICNLVSKDKVPDNAKTKEKSWTGQSKVAVDPIHVMTHVDLMKDEPMKPIIGDWYGKSAVPTDTDGSASHGTAKDNTVKKTKNKKGTDKKSTLAGNDAAKLTKKVNKPSKVVGKASRWVLGRSSNKNDTKSDSADFFFHGYVHKTYTIGVELFLARRLSKSMLLANRSNLTEVLRITRLDIERPQLQSLKLPSLSRRGNSLLSLDDERHVVISPYSINLHDEYGTVSQSVQLKNQEYTPNVAAYVNSLSFLTMDTKRALIGFHNSGSLQVLNTYPLIYGVPLKKIMDDAFIFCTSDGDVVLQTSKDQAKVFSRVGKFKRLADLHPDIFTCKVNTICSDNKLSETKVFGVQNDGTIVSFTLYGDCSVVSKLDNVRNVCSAGIDEERNIYVSYYTTDSTALLAKVCYDGN